MKKLLVSTCILAALGLAGCGGDTIKDIQADTTVDTPFTRVVFDPAAGVLSIPNDLLMIPGEGQVFDYTLNIPVADTSDFSDPQNALNSQDGWSTNYPFQVAIDTPTNVTLDESTLAAGVRIFEATLGLDIADAECQAIAIPSAGCKMGTELQLGVDFALTVSDGNTINVIPLKPFTAAKGHMLVITNALKDSSGKGVQGSTTWDLVKQDIATAPLATESQLSLQTLVNTYVDALDSVSISRDEISYVQVFTTQSVDTALSTVKQLQVAEFAVTSAAQQPSIVVTNPNVNGSAHENVVATFDINGNSLAASIGLPAALEYSSIESCAGVLPAAAGQFLAATGQTTGDAATDTLINDTLQLVASAFAVNCAATVYDANISLSYYSGVPTATNPMAPVNEFWDAACDSGIALRSALGTGILDAATPGPNAALCQQVGLNDVRLGDAMFDSSRFITKFSPVPQAKGSENGKETLDVQITVPNVAVAAALGQTIEMPDGGWPVVMLVHGITSQKEAMLNISGALSLAGFATVSIDQPIHGSRGFDLTGNGVDDINATTVSATHYLNLASLPTARDNSKQAVADLLGVRLGLNALFDATGGNVQVNPSNVSVMGVSLGAITGGMFASIANNPLPGEAAPFSSLYAVKAASLESPGGGIANFLFESNAFGPLVKGSLLQQGSPDFQAALVAQFGTVEVTQEQLVAATLGFLAALNTEQLAAVNSLFTQFAFAAQTLTDSSDPINYFANLASNTPVHMMTVVGDGSEDNLPDQVIPVTTSLPLSGQLPLAQIMELDTIASTQMGDPISGLVLFNSGAHASSLSFERSAAVYAEMQSQVAAYMASEATVIQVTNESVVQN